LPGLKGNRSALAVASTTVSRARNRAREKRKQDRKKVFITIFSLFVYHKWAVAVSREKGGTQEKSAILPEAVKADLTQRTQGYAEEGFNPG